MVTELSIVKVDVVAACNRPPSLSPDLTGSEVWNTSPGAIDNPSRPVANVTTSVSMRSVNNMALPNL